MTVTRRVASATRSAGPAPSAMSARLAGLDWILMGATLALMVLGTALVWSATSARTDLTGGDGTAYLSKQIVNVVLGLVLMTAVILTSHRWVRALAPVAYVGSLVALGLVLVMGSTINGSRSWLLVGGMSLQPSEFAKVTVVVGMALVMAERRRRRGRTEARSLDVVAMLAVAAIPAALILAQPDLGTMLVLTATVFGVLVAAGASRAWLTILAMGGVSAAIGASVFGVLKPYQIDRFLAFINPGLDPRGAGYNTEQARIAVGNGGWFGEGLFHGSQTRSGFVPEQHTDFIFTVAGEELGLVGSSVLIALLSVIVWRALVIARSTDDTFGRVAAAGIGCWFGFQAFQNVGMCLGIMPVTGVPLPFVSYGGSSLFACLVAVGLLQNIHRRAQAPRVGRLVGRDVRW